MATKYIFVTGGVLSGLGKGITAASIGNVLKSKGINVSIQKCDPYLNVDAGMLNPAEHGECYVTADGAETDLDLGHYERFLDQEMTKASSLMSGKVLLEVISDERNGKYAGKTVQFIPHVTKAIIERIQSSGEKSDVHIVEIGGTVGDYEGLSFIEAIRELGMKVGPENCIFVHVIYVPYLGASHEFKTKPAQNAVRDLRGLGITPEILAVRTESPAPKEIVDKLSLYSGVPTNSIVLLPNADSIYDVPLTLEDAGIGEVIVKKLRLTPSASDLNQWRELNKQVHSKKKQTVSVAIIAKYMDNTDTYMSVFEALKSAAWKAEVEVAIHWVDAEELKHSSLQEIDSILDQYDGVLVPGGFGLRGLEGKIKAAKYCLDAKKPYFGICLGLQMAVVAAARRAGLKDATSEEMDVKSQQLVIHTMTDQRGKENTGGTMRLGNYDCVLQKDSLIQKLFDGATEVTERHRHRYECNNDYRDRYANWGILASGTSPDGHLVEMIEGVGHPFFVASQSHPEFLSRPLRPHPLFLGFIEACKKAQIIKQ